MEHHNTVVWSTKMKKKKRAKIYCCNYIFCLQVFYFPFYLYIQLSTLYIIFCDILYFSFLYNHYISCNFLYFSFLYNHYISCDFFFFYFKLLWSFEPIYIYIEKKFTALRMCVTLLLYIGVWVIIYYSRIKSDSHLLPFNLLWRSEKSTPLWVTWGVALCTWTIQW